MPTYGSLFSGIGGIDLGLDRSGWTCKWQVEIDEKARAVLEKHWPGVPKFEDIRGTGGHNLPRVDLVAGGFPCQPASVAGQRKGTADARWLWPEFARVVFELQPRYVLFENVPGLLTVDGGRAFAGVLADLAALGFDAEWVSVPAAVFGAKHYRLRLFLVAYSKGDRRVQGRSVSSELLRLFGGGSDQPCADVAGGVGQGLEVFPQQPAWEELATTERGREWRQWWEVEPGMGRMVDGLPGRVGQLKQLGNAVVPQVAQWVGEQLMAFHERTIRDGAV